MVGAFRTVCIHIVVRLTLAWRRSRAKLLLPPLTLVPVSGASWDRLRVR
jgi:hypothetical protein